MAAKDDELPIGAVAARAGVAVSALRFYEDRGLITSTRSPGGRRQFPRHVLRRLAFIQAAQRVGGGEGGEGGPPKPAAMIMPP